MHCEEGDTAQRIPVHVGVVHGVLLLGSTLLSVCLLVFWLGKEKEKNLTGKSFIEIIQK